MELSSTRLIKRRPRENSGKVRLATAPPADTGYLKLNGLSWVKEWLEGLGQLTLLAREAVVSLFCRPFDVRQSIYQIYFIGAKSQSVALITGAFTGMVLAAQTYFQFHKVRMDTATMAVVSVSMCSELGPVLTGLMVAGRVGAALAQSWAPCA